MSWDDLQPPERLVPYPRDYKGEVEEALNAPDTFDTFFGVKMLDITADDPNQPVEIRIRGDGKVVWVNLGERCILRLSQIAALQVVDERAKWVFSGHQHDEATFDNYVKGVRYTSGPELTSAKEQVHGHRVSARVGRPALWLDQAPNTEGHSHRLMLGAEYQGIEVSDVKESTGD